MRARLNWRLRLRLPAVLSVLGVAGATVLVGPAPAAEADPGIVRVTKTSVYDSSTTKVATAQCPAGTMVIGGGGYIPTIRPPARTGELFITALRPLVSLFGTGFQVRATEDDTGFNDIWRLVAVAECAPAPPGLGYGWHTSTSSSAASRSAAVKCSPGKRVIGTGGVVNGGGRHVVLEASFATPDALTHAVALAHEDETGYAGNWSVTAWSICADPLPGLERVVDTGPYAPGWTHAECPANKRQFSVGALLSGGAGQARLDAAYPTDDDPFASNVVSGREDETGYAYPWSVTAIAVCAY